jgi:hypothetical protein
MDNFRDFIGELGFEQHEQVMALTVHAVWVSIDWNMPLWRTAGPAVYDRFESRVRAASREATVHGFAARLARKCHVATPRFDAPLLVDMAQESLDAIKALNFTRRESGLVVATIRAFNDERKVKRGESAPKKKKEAQLPLDEVTEEVL